MEEKEGEEREGKGTRMEKEKGRGKEKVRKGREEKKGKHFPWKAEVLEREGSSAFPLDRKCSDKKGKTPLFEKNDPGSVRLPGKKLLNTLIAF